MNVHGYSFFRCGTLILSVASLILFSCRKDHTVPDPKTDPNALPQNPTSFTVQYSKLLGGSGYESGRSTSTPDGGIILAATTTSANEDVHGSHGNQDAWVVKLNSNGDTSWTRTLGGSDDDIATYVVVTPDGGYLITGATKSDNGDITDKRRNFGEDAWVIKLDGGGHTVWSKTYGSTAVDQAFSAILTTDGGYLVVGVGGNNDGDISGYKGGGDAWALKLNANGNIAWSKVYGGTGWDQASQAAAVTGGYILGGLTNSGDGDVKGYHVPQYIGADFLAAKIDLNGNLVWAKAYGGTNDEVANSIVPASDGVVIAGYTSSKDGDVTGYHGTQAFFIDMWALKLNGDGNIVWAKTYGGTWDDAVTSMVATSDGGFVLAGATGSNDGDVVANHNAKDGNEDAWIVKIDAAGNKQWVKNFGGPGDEVAYSLSLNPGGFTISGIAEGTGGDVTGNYRGGAYDIWVAKVMVK